MDKPQVFKKRPVEIAAIEYRGHNLNIIKEWFPDCKIKSKYPKDVVAYIDTLEGEMMIGIGWWIIRGINGEYYGCAPDIFKKTYRLNNYKVVTKDLKYIKKL